MGIGLLIGVLGCVWHWKGYLSIVFVDVSECEVYIQARCWVERDLGNSFGLVKVRNK